MALRTSGYASLQYKTVPPKRDNREVHLPHPPLSMTQTHTHTHTGTSTRLILEPKHFLKGRDCSIRRHERHVTGPLRRHGGDKWRETIFFFHSLCSPLEDGSDVRIVWQWSRKRMGGK